MQKWEYLTVYDVKVNEELQKLGEEGWELVTAYSAVPPGRNFPSVYFVFKRPKP